MTDILAGYSVQYWLEAAAQGYLLGTEYGHLPGESEPEVLLNDARLREQAIEVTAQLVIFERCSLEVAAGLIRLAPDDPSRCFLATQCVDEARHLEVFKQRLLDLGVARDALDDVVRDAANPHLVRLGELLAEKVAKGDFLAGVFGQHVILEGMATHVFELLHAANDGINPKFAHTLSGVLADESRHAFFGEHRVEELIRHGDSRHGELEAMQREMAGAMLATFASAFRSVPRSQERMRLREELARRRGGVAEPRSLWHGEAIDDLEPEELERRLARSVLDDWRRRFERLGLAYQRPAGY